MTSCWAKTQRSVPRAGGTPRKIGWDERPASQNPSPIYVRKLRSFLPAPRWLDGSVTGIAEIMGSNPVNLRPNFFVRL